MSGGKAYVARHKIQAVWVVLALKKLGWFGFQPAPGTLWGPFSMDVPQQVADGCRR